MPRQIRVDNDITRPIILSGFGTFKANRAGSQKPAQAYPAFPCFYVASRGLVEAFACG